LTEATRRVLEATGVEFEWDVQLAGADVMDRFGGNPLPETTLAAIRDAGVAMKGPITTPVGGGFRSVNVGLRKALDLYAQVRPCKSYPGVRSRFESVDLVVVRENTEDLYSGIEYAAGSADAVELIVDGGAGRATRARGRRDLDQTDLDPGTRESCSSHSTTRAERPPQGDGGAQGEHHEVQRRAVPGHRARGRAAQQEDIEF
jgi:hypothetical protein